MQNNKMREIIEQLDNRTLYVNLAITQGALFIVGIILYTIFLRTTMPLQELFHLDGFLFAVGVGAAFAICVVCLDLILMKTLPHHFFDDGGINERVFRDVNVYQIALIALCVALTEEWLFRAVLQNIVGFVWASLLFALVHYRYFKHWLYALLVIVLSFGFGYMYEWLGSIWSVIIAHFVIDFILGLIIRYGRGIFILNHSN